jgi:hypothetical protein
MFAKSVLWQDPTQTFIDAIPLAMEKILSPTAAAGVARSLENLGSLPEDEKNAIAPSLHTNDALLKLSGSIMVGKTNQGQRCTLLT